MIELETSEVMDKTMWTAKDRLLGKYKQVTHGLHIKLGLQDTGYLGILGLTGFRVMALVHPSRKSTDKYEF